MVSGNQILRVFIWLWRLLCQKLLLSFFCLRHWASLAKAGWDSCALLVKAKLPFTKDGCSLCQIDVQNCPKSLIKIRAAFVSFCHWKAKDKGREKSKRSSWWGGVKEKENLRENLGARMIESEKEKVEWLPAMIYIFRCRVLSIAKLLLQLSNHCRWEIWRNISRVLRRREFSRLPNMLWLFHFSTC